MSKQVGARTHASAALAPHVSRTAAVGLAVFLTLGYGASAHAGEGSDVSGVGTADMGVGAVGGTADAAVGGTAHAGGDARPGERAAPRSDDAPGRPGKADGTIEISATSSDTDLVTLVVVTADGRRTTTVTPVPEATDSLVAGPGQLRRADATVAVAAAGKDGRSGGIAQRTGDEILAAAGGSARNRPAALVLPQTGAAESLGIDTGAGLLMVLAGVMTLRGRRRSTG